MQQEQIKDFLKRYSEGNFSENEHQEFVDWVKTAPIEEVEAIADQYKDIFISSKPGTGDSSLVNEIETALNQYELGTSSPASNAPSLRSARELQKEKGVVRKLWKRVAVAASVILAVGIGGYLLFFNKPEQSSEIVKGPEVIPGDVKAPETNRAMITLADGRQVYLDEAANGELSMVNGVRLMKQADGKIVYSSEFRVQGSELVYNTLSNPKGSKVIDMTLSDGSRVWLNAGSSVTYPVAFVGNDRKVSITGEAYFEVAHDASKPFYVSKGDMQVQVLGTHFNVNAYDDEGAIRVTLLEGSVRLMQNAQSTMLIPGQQGEILRSAQNDKIKVSSNVDVEQVMAWKEGMFKFKNTNIDEIMRQVARWYNVDIEYLGKFSDLNFGGSVSRQANVSELLKRLEATEAVRFKVDGRRIVVMK